MQGAPVVSGMFCVEIGGLEIRGVRGPLGVDEDLRRALWDIDFETCWKNTDNFYPQSSYSSCSKSRS